MFFMISVESLDLVVDMIVLAMTFVARFGSSHYRGNNRCAGFPQQQALRPLQDTEQHRALACHAGSGRGAYTSRSDGGESYLFVIYLIPATMVYIF